MDGGWVMDGWWMDVGWTDGWMDGRVEREILNDTQVVVSIASQCLSCFVQ